MSVQVCNSQFGKPFEQDACLREVDQRSEHTSFIDHADPDGRFQRLEEGARPRCRNPQYGCGESQHTRVKDRTGSLALRTVVFIDQLSLESPKREPVKRDSQIFERSHFAPKGGLTG
jgi:hypothetical protein